MSQPAPHARLRWWLCGLLFAATALSFLDRQVLSVLAPIITRQLRMTNVEYSHVTTAFLVSYAVMFLIGGRLMDVLGTRLGMAICVGAWSIASALHALIRTPLQLGMFRFLLGAGEGGCFPGAAKGVAEWFTPKQRALAMGIAIGGSSLGAVLAPPLTGWLSPLIGWRWVFVVTGGLGLVWVAGWWILTGVKANVEHPTSNIQHRRQEGGTPLRLLLGRSDVWGLALVRFIVDPVFYFYMFWIPKYLATERSASLQTIAALTWIPFLALGVSNIMGGWASDLLIKRGMPALRARRIVMAAAALLTISSAFAATMKSIEMSIAMMFLLMLAHGFWITNYVTVISERFPKGAVGTVMGFAGAVGAVGGMMANTAIGWIVDKFSYAPVWVASGLMYPAAFAVLLMMIRGRSLLEQADSSRGFEVIEGSRS